MEAKSFMIGDWVSSPRLRSHGGGNYLHQLERIDLGCAYDPIPLTEEIFKSNCFDIVQDGDSLTIWKQKDDEYGNEVYDITIYASKGVIRFDTSIHYRGAIRKNIYYVHELQHTLRIIGLNELADNFKIE